MDQNSENLITHKHSITFFCLIIGAILLFLFLEPKISSEVIPGKSASLLTHFIQETVASESVNARDFWKFREFYSPGSYGYNPSGLSSPAPLTSFAKPEKFIPSLTFTSPKLVSTEGHTKTMTLAGNEITAITKGQVLINTPHTLLIKQQDGSYLLVFLTTVTEIKKANGFLQHETAENDKAGNYWLSISIISP